MSAIEVSCLTKTFGSHKVVENLSFSLPANSFLSVLGPNGAGKTTLLRMLATLERPNAGNIVISGINAKEDPDAIRSRVGLVTHHAMLYPDLTVEENLVFYGNLYRVEDPKQKANELLKVTGMSSRRLDCVRTLSRGMTQRVALARALVHDPKIILLDEPYAGLDPQGAEAFDNLLLSMKNDKSIVMVTHNPLHGLRLATHVLVLKKDLTSLLTTPNELGDAQLREIYGNSNYRNKDHKNNNFKSTNELGVI